MELIDWAWEVFGEDTILIVSYKKHDYVTHISFYKETVEAWAEEYCKTAGIILEFTRLEWDEGDDTSPGRWLRAFTFDRFEETMLAPGDAANALIHSFVTDQLALA